MPALVIGLDPSLLASVIVIVVADGAEVTIYLVSSKLLSENAELPGMPLTLSNKTMSSSCKLCGLGKVTVIVGEPFVLVKLTALIVVLIGWMS